MQSSVLAVAGGDGVDGAHLSMLVKEAVALMALRNTGAGWTFSPKVADFWIGGTPGRMLEHQFGTTTIGVNIRKEPHYFGCVSLLLVGIRAGQISNRVNTDRW